MINFTEVTLALTAEVETSNIKDKKVKIYAKNILKNVVSKISLILLKY